MGIQQIYLLLQKYIDKQIGICMIVVVIISLALIVAAIMLIMGKGDWLIAGYNTASEEERKTVNIKRLRLVMALSMLLTALVIIVPVLMGKIEDRNTGINMAFGIIGICLITVILANTWCKKK
jgi:nitric oxide reductase large subunit